MPTPVLRWKAGPDGQREHALGANETLIGRSPDADIVLLLGGDSLKDLPSWRRPHDLLGLCHLIGVMRRPGDAVDLPAMERELPGIRAKVRVVDAPLLQIASREIRERIRRGLPYRYYLPPAVFEYIQQETVYRRDVTQRKVPPSMQHR